MVNAGTTDAVVRYTITGISIDGCSSSGFTDITVNPLPTTANAGADQSLCNSTITTLNASAPVIGSGSWSFVSGPNTPSFININDPSTSVSGLLPGTYTFKWSVTNGSCITTEDLVAITVNSPTVAGTLSSDAIVCAAGNSGILTLAGLTGNVIGWELSVNNGGTWSGDNITSTTYHFANLTSTTLFRAKVQHNNCLVETSNIVTITVLQSPTTALAGNDQMLNNIATAVLAANNPAQGTGTWSQISGPNTAIFSNYNAYNAGISGLMEGTYTFRWTISNGSCGTSFDEMNLVVQPATVPGILTADATVCAIGGNGATLQLSGYTGTVIQWELSVNNGISWTPFSNTTDQFTYTNLTATTLYRVLVQSGIGVPAYSTIATIQVNPITNPGTLTGATTVCSSTNSGIISLTGNNGNILHWEYSTNGGIDWSVISHTGNTYTFNNLTGNTLYRVLVQNGACADTYSNSIAITIDQPTNPGTLHGDATVCYGSNNGSVQLTGNNGSVQFWEYSTDGGNQWNNISQTGNSYNYSGLTQTTSFRAHLRNGACNTVIGNTVTITVTPLSIGGNITGSGTICKSNNSGTLTLTGNTGSVVEWQSSTDGGNTWSVISNNTHDYTYTNISTTTQFRVLVQNGSCSPVYSTVAILNVNEVTIPGIISGGGNFCSGMNNGTIQLTGNNGSVVHWEVSINNGGSWSIISNTNTLHNYSNLTNSSQFRALVQNGICGAAYTNATTIGITDTLTNIITIKSYVVCENQSVTIDAGPAAGGTGTYQYEWQQSTDGNNWSIISGANGVQYSFTPSAQTLFLRRVVYSLPCSKISNVITVNRQPSIANNMLPATIAICYDSSATIQGSLPTGGDGKYTYTWQSSIDGGINWITIPGATQKDYTISAVNGNITYRRMVSTLLCSGVQENISNITTIIIKHKPTAIFKVFPDTACSPANMSFQNLSVGNNALYHFSLVDDKDSSTTTLSPIIHTYHSDTLVSLNSHLVASNECGTDSTFRIVTIKPDFIQPNLIISDSSLCGPGSISFTNNTKGALKYTWDFGDGSTILEQTGNSVITHQYTKPGIYQFTLEAHNDCSIYIIRHNIRIYPAPKASFTIHQPDFCVGDSIRFTNQASHSNQYYWNFSNDHSASEANPVTTYKNRAHFKRLLIAGTIYAPDNKACFDTAALSINIVGTRKGSMLVSKLTNNCLPQTINTLSLNVPASSVAWTWGDGSSNTGDSASHQYFNNGKYLITMIATSAGGCKFIDSSLLIISSPSGSVRFSDNAVCLGQQTIFYTTIIDPQVNPSDSILWHFGDGTIKTTTTTGNFSYQYPKAGIYHPKAWLLKASGCRIALTISDSIHVDEVISKFGLSGVFECGTTTYQFVDSSKAVFGIRSWKWIMNGIDSSYERMKVSRFTQKGSHSTSLVVEGNSGCKSVSQVNFDVQVYQYPVANINAMAEACKTDLLELKSNINSQDSVALRLWSLGNGQSAQDSVIKATFVKDGVYNIKLTVATINNCYDSVYKQVTVHPLPNISVQQSNIVCRGDSITIRANGATKFIWKDQSEKIICTDCAEIKVKPGSSTSYKVIGYNQFGCSEIKSTNVRVVNPLKMVTATSDTLCAGQSSHLFATGASTYQWLPNNSFPGSYTSTVTVRPEETTIYKVIGKDAFNCFTDTAEIKVVVGKPTPVTLGKDTTLVSGGTYQLRLQSATNDIVKWRWSGTQGISCATCPTPVVKLSDDACISCTAINQFGCISSDTICIKTFCPTTEVFVPNAFTPDGDGINDKLVVQGKGIRLIKSFRIFNRWGEMVFEKVNFYPGDPAYGWDGKIRGNTASPDVYVYVCEVICEKGLPSIFKGNTAILK